ncbi:hypothetical protein KI387_035273, partial [Taxus chinensis]
QLKKEIQRPKPQVQKFKKEQASQSAQKDSKSLTDKKEESTVTNVKSEKGGRIGFETFL